MNRRSALLTLLAPVVVPVGAHATPRFRAYSRVLPDFLSALAREAYERRNAALNAIRTPVDLKARQLFVRDTLWRLIGGQPQRLPLDVRSAGGFERAGYRVEKLSYSTWPGVRVPANLYIPASGHPPYPGVLFQLGHSVNGKAADTYQKCCQSLAQLGFVVLAFDPFGQGERTWYHVDNPDEEHSRLGRQALLVGASATQIQLWDAVRSLDVLALHPQVDPRRLASMGQSGGATLTMLLAAVDSRLACAAVSCGNTENFACAGFNPPGSTDDAEQDLIGSGPLGFDRWDLLYPLAPKPLLVIVSERDSFGTYSPSYLTSGEEEFAKLQRIYALAGAESSLQCKSTALPHALSHPLRVHCYEFLCRWLQGRTGSVAEPAVAPEPDDVLTVGIPNARPPLPAPAPRPLESPAQLRDLLRLPELRLGSATVLSRESAEGCAVETIDVPSEPGVFLPAYVFVPPPSAPTRAALLLLEPGGRTVHWREGSFCHRLAAAGTLVCAFDVRGMGDLTPEVGRGNPAYTSEHAGEEAYAWASLILGRPLLGQRVADVLAAVAAVAHSYAAGRRIVLAASGHMTLPALCAAALDTRIGAVYLSGGLVSWSALLADDRYREPFSSFLPGVLIRTDLPDIARLIAPRKLIVAGATDAAGKLLPLAGVQRAYGPPVEVRPVSAWDLATLSAIAG